MSRRKYNRSILFALGVITAAFAVTRCSPVAPSISKLAGMPAAPKSTPFLPVTSEPAAIQAEIPAPTPSKSASAPKNHHCIYTLPSDHAPHHEMLDSISELGDIQYQWKLNDSEIYALKNNGAIHKSIRGLKGQTIQTLQAWARVSKAEVSLNTLEDAPIQLQLEGDTLTIELSKNILYLNAIDELGISLLDSAKECIPAAKVAEDLSDLEGDSNSQNADLLL